MGLFLNESNCSLDYKDSQFSLYLNTVADEAVKITKCFVQYKNKLELDRPDICIGTVYKRNIMFVNFEVYFRCSCTK